MHLNRLLATHTFRGIAAAFALTVALMTVHTTNAFIAPLDLSVGASQNPLIVTNVGQPVDIRIRVRSTGLIVRAPIGGGGALNVVMKATVPSQLSFSTVTAPAGWTCGIAGQVVTCSTPVMAFGTSALFTIPATAAAIPPDGQARTTATVATSDKESTLVNNSAIAGTSLP